MIYTGYFAKEKYYPKRLKRYCKRLQMRYNKVSRKRGNKNDKSYDKIYQE